MDSPLMAFPSTVMDVVTTMTLSPTVCCCFQRFTVAIRLDHSVTMSTGSTVVGANIIQPDHQLALPFEGKRLHECQLDHAKHTEVDVVFSAANWDLVAQHHDEVVLILARYDDDRVRLMADDAMTGVIPLARFRTLQGSGIRVAEAFAGAYSGWSHAVTDFQEVGVDLSHCWMIDFDVTCARAYVQTHPGASVCESPRMLQELRAEAALNDEDVASVFPPVYVVSNITNLWWLAVVDNQCLDVLLASPPCPPWSLADTAPGLSRADGVVLISFLLLAGYIQPKCIALENVTGLLTHKDWALVVRVIHFAGFDIHWKHSCDLASVVPQHRDRCLLVLLHKSALDSPKLPCIMWPACVKPSLGTFDAIYSGDHPWILDMQLSQEELDLYFRMDAFPKAAKRKSAIPCTEAEMLRYRVKSKLDQAGCFLTTYGKPLQLGEALVSRGGVLGALYMEGNMIRKFNPVEALILLGTKKPTWIPTDWGSAFHQLGNAISRPHALLALINALNTIADLPLTRDPQMLLADMIADHMVGSQISVTTSVDGAVISKKMNEPDGGIPPTVPMRVVSRLVIQGVGLRTEVNCEAGVDLRKMLGLLFAMDSTMPVMIPVNSPLKKDVPMPVGMAMPAYDLVLKVPSIPKLTLNEKNFQQSSELAGMLAVFTPKGLLVLTTETVHFPADVLLAVHLLSWFDDVTLSCMGVQGSLLPPNQRCPTFVMVCEDQSALPISSADLTNLYFQPVSDAFHALIPVAQADALLLQLERAGILESLMALGWHLTRQMRSQSGGLAFVLLVSIAGRPSVSAVAIQQYLTARIFHHQLTMRCAQASTGVRMMVKVWNTWFWDGNIDETITGTNLQSMWKDASAVFGNAMTMRICIDGQIINPERPLVETARWHDQVGVCVKVHLVPEPRGGGPSRQVNQNRDPTPSPPIEVHDDDPDPVALEPINFTEAISMVLRSIMARCIPDRYVPVEILCGLKMEQVNGMLHMQASIPEVISFMQLLRYIGVEDAIEDMGWQTLMQFCRFEHPAVVRMVMVPRPDVQYMSREGILAILLGALYAFSLPKPVPLSDDAVFVRVKLWDCWVFEGYLNGNAPCNVLLENWVPIGTFVRRQEVFRLICQGKQASNEFPIKDYSRIDAFGRRIAWFHLVRRLHGGGRGPPPSQITSVKTDLATFLLRQGAELKELSMFIDKLLLAAGVPAVGRVVAMDNQISKLDAVKQLAQSLGMKPLTFQSQSQRKTEPKKSPVNAKVKPVMKASDFKIQEGFFKTQAGDNCACCEVVQASAHGVILLDVEDAVPWIKDPSQVSADELAVLVLGTCPLQGSDRCNVVNTPAVTMDGTCVLVATCLHQLGEKEVTWETSQKADVAVTETCVLAVTVFRDEVSEEQWTAILAAPVKATFEMLQSVGGNVQTSCPPWGRSWQMQGKKADPNVASSLQFHCRVEQKCMSDLLRLSGVRGVYLTPNANSNQADPLYAVIWLQMEVDELKVKLSSCPKHLGLVRVDKAGGRKTNRGIRCHNKDHATMFTALKPGVLAATHVQCKVYAKLAPTPVGASQSQVQEWLSQVGWTAKPLKPLGSAAWLIGAPSKPDECFATWNNSTIMLQWLPEKTHKSGDVVLAGPRPKIDRNMPESPWQDKDPWEQFISRNNGKTGLVGASKPVTAHASKAIEGPTEQRLNQQAKEISELRDAMGQINSRVDESNAQQKSFQAEVHKGFATVRAEFSDACTVLNQTFEKSLAGAMTKQDKKLQSNFQEIKELLAAKNTPKKKKAKTAPNQSGEAVDDDSM